MALPIRRATPQPRTKPVKAQRIFAAPLGAPQAPPVFALRGKFWIPRLPRAPLKSSRLVRPAPVAAPQAKSIFAKTPYRAWILRPSRSTSRRVVPASVVAAAIPPATLALQGSKRALIRPRITGSRRIAAASLASPQAASTNVAGVKRGPTRPQRSRLVAPAPPADPQALSTRRTRGIVRPPTKNRTSRLFVGIPPSLAQPTPTFALRGVRWARLRSGTSRSVLPAPLAAPQANSTRVTGIRRGPVRNNHSRFFAGAVLAGQSPTVSIRALQGARPVHPKRPLISRLFVAPLGSPQPRSTNVAGIRRSQAKVRPPRFFIGAAPVGGNPLLLLAIIGYSRASSVIGRSRATAVNGMSRAMKATGRSRAMLVTGISRISKITGRMR